MTAGLRLAIMLDNAFTAAQVRPLLVGSPASMVVVTSRNRLTGLGVNGARFHPLDVLDTDASLELLERGIGRDRVAREPEAARQIVDRCAGLPLAVSLATARLAARPRQPVRAMADALARDEGPLAILKVDGETAVRTALDVSYAALGESTARVYRLLGLLPLHTFESRITAAACALPLDEAEALLDELIEVNLVEDAGPGPDDCRFHDLVREHARERATASDGSVREGDETVQRVCDYYLATVSAAEARLTPARIGLVRDHTCPPGLPPAFDNDASALSWLDQQRLNLMACIRTAAERQWDDTAWQLVDACWALFLRLRYYDLWIEAHEIGLACARRSSHPQRHQAERQMLTSGAIGLSAAGRTDQAIRWYEDALRAARETGDGRDEGQALLGLGGCHVDIGRYTQAVAYAQGAIDAWEACGYPRGVTLAQTVIGETLLKTDEPRQAVGLLARARDTFVAVHDPHDAARALAMLGRARVAAGDHAAGMAELDQALTVFRGSGSLHWQARALEMLGESAEAHGDLTAAVHHFAQALTLHEAISPADAQRLRERITKSHKDSGGADTTAPAP